MKIRIQHRTTYMYKEPVSFGSHKIMMRPREGHDVHIESSVLEIHPAHTIHWMRDVNGNCIAKVDFTEMAHKLSFYSEIVLQQYDANPFDFVIEDSAVYYPFVYEPETLAELTAYTLIIYPKDTARLREWLTQFWKPGDKIETFALLQRLNRHIYDNFQYKRRDEAGVQTPAATLDKKSGSCRDFATLFLEACRCWGLAARFASGYMQCEATEAGGASTHAWAEVYLPGAGWKGFDPTSGIMTASKHVTTAVSRDPENAAPISGSFSGRANVGIGIQVDVTVVEMDRPSSNKPPVPQMNLHAQVQPALPQEMMQQQAQQEQQQESPLPMDMVIHSISPLAPQPA